MAKEKTSRSELIGPIDEIRLWITAIDTLQNLEDEFARRGLAEQSFIMLMDRTRLETNPPIKAMETVLELSESFEERLRIDLDRLEGNLQKPPQN